MEVVAQFTMISFNLPIKLQFKKYMNMLTQLPGCRKWVGYRDMEQSYTKTLEKIMQQVGGRTQPTPTSDTARIELEIMVSIIEPVNSHVNYILKMAHKYRMRQEERRMGNFVPLALLGLMMDVPNASATILLLMTAHSF